MQPDQPKTPAQQIAESPDARADRVVDVQRAEGAAERDATVAETQVQADRERAQRDERGRQEAEKRKAWAEKQGRSEAEGVDPEGGLDHPAVTTRLLEWMRLRGMLSHRELVEILGVGHVEIDHRHPDSGAPETKEVTVNGVTRQQRIGKASVAEDSVAARHYVQELLRPGSTRPPDEGQGEAA